MKRFAAILLVISAITVSCRKSSQEDFVPVSSIAISQSALTLTQGEKLQLTAQVFPDDASVQDVKWISSASGVAKVYEDGLVLAIGPGTASITASAGGKSASCKVTVAGVDKTPANIPVEDIVLHLGQVTLTVDEQILLEADIYPENASDKKIIWKSGDTKTATVNNDGLLTAVKAGKTSVIATAGGKSAECTVTVEEKVIHVEQVILSRTSLNLEVGGQLTLKAYVYPEEPLEILFLSVEREAVNVLLIHHPGNGGRGGHAVNHMRTAVFALDDLRKILPLRTNRAFVVHTVILDEFSTRRNEVELLFQEFFTDLLQRRAAVRTELFRVRKIHQDFFYRKTGKFFLHGGLALAGLGRLFLRGFLFFFRQSFRLLLQLCFIKQGKLARNIQMSFTGPAEQFLCQIVHLLFQVVTFRLQSSFPFPHGRDRFLQCADGLI